MERYLYDGLSFEVLAELCEEGWTEEERSNRWAPSKRRKVTCEYQRAGGRLIGRSEYEREGRNRHRERVQKHYYLQDVLGSVVALSDERGHERQRCAYDAWGGEYERRGPGRNGNGHHLWQQGPHKGTGYGYTGKRLDRPAGLYDYGFRDYKPRISRWTTVDPIRDGRNWYSYVENDPVNFVDPLGLEWKRTGGFGDMYSSYESDNPGHHGEDWKWENDETGANETVGQPVPAVNAGEVTDVNENDTLGKHVRTENQNGEETVYAHLSDNSYVKEGKGIDVGDYIGEGGNTGMSTGPHVHIAESVPESNTLEEDYINKYNKNYTDPPDLDTAQSVADERFNQYKENIQSHDPGSTEAKESK